MKRRKTARKWVARLGVSVVLTGVSVVQAQEQTLSEVQVTATKEAQDMRRNASAGKLVFDRQELDTLDAASVGELLRKLPGTGMFADIDSGPKGRGRGPDRNMPQILVDGQPLPGGDRNPMAALRLPIDMIERVEVIRNSTAEFPVLNPAGVINLILRDVPPKVTRGLKLGAGAMGSDPQFRFEGQYGEPDQDFGYLIAGGMNQRPTSGTRQLQGQSYTAGVPSGQTSEDARTQGTDTMAMLTPRFTWSLPGRQKLSLTPFLGYNEADRETTLARQQSGVSSSDRERDQMRRSTVRLGGEWRASGDQGAETSLRLMLQNENERADKQTDRYDATGTRLSFLTDHTERTEQGGMMEARGKRLLGENHLLTVASETWVKRSEDRQQRSGSQSSNALATLDELRQVFWGQDEWQINDQHLLTPGLRLTRQSLTLDDRASGRISRDFQFLDPSLHYLWQLSSAWNLRASLAFNSRTPHTRDLLPATRLSSGTHSSSNPDRAGNAQLEPERMRSLEVGFEHFLADRAGTIGLSTFHRHVDNYMQRLTQLESGRWVERPYNVGEAQLTGAVFDFKSRMTALGLPGLTLRGNAAYTHVRMLSQVAGLGAGEGPRKSANLGIDHEIPSWRLTLGGNVNYVSSLDRESSATVQQTQGMRRQVDLYALYKIDRQVAVRVSAQNITRETRRNDTLETDSSGALLRQESEFTPGVASYMVTLEMKW